MTLLLPSALLYLSTQGLLILYLNCLSILKRLQDHKQKSSQSYWPYSCNNSKGKNLKHCCTVIKTPEIGVSFAINRETGKKIALEGFMQILGLIKTGMSSDLSELNIRQTYNFYST